MHEIPPGELDEYLAEFFTDLRLPSGEEYKLESLCPLRSYLERYLKDCGYPESIISSSAFAKSQEAYRRKKEHIAQMQSTVVHRP